MRITSFILLFSIAIGLHAQSTDDFLLGMSSFLSKDYSAADLNFTNAVKAKNNTAKSIYYRGICKYFTKDLNGAKEDLLAAKNKGIEAADLWLAKLYASEQSPQKAVQFLKLYLNSPPKEFTTDVIKDPAFKSIHETGEWQDFVSSYSITSMESKLMDADYEIKSRNTQKAHNTLDLLIANNSNNAKAHELKAQAYEQNELYELAIIELKKAIDSEPEWYYYSSLGDNYTLVDKSLLAIEAYKEVIVISPESFETYLKLASTYLKAKEPELAKEQIKTYQTYIKNDKDASLIASDIYLELNDSKSALKEVNKLFNSTETPKAEWFLSRGKIYYGLEYNQSAAEDLSMVLDLDPENPEVNFLLGNAYKRTNNNKLACYYWKRAKKYGYLEAIEQILNNCE